MLKIVFIFKIKAFLPYCFIKAMTNFVFVKKSVNKEFIIKFGNNLRKIRESKKITMQALADTINVEYSQISRIERGVINTSIGLIYEIAQALNIDVKELFNFEKD